MDRGPFTLTVPALWEEKAGPDGWTYRFRPADGSETTLVIEKKPGPYKDDADLRSKLDQIAAALRQRHGSNLASTGVKLAGIDAVRHAYPGQPGTSFLIAGGAQKKLLLVAVASTRDSAPFPPEADAFLAGLQLRKERKDPLGGLLGGLDKIASDLESFSKSIDKLLNPGSIAGQPKPDAKSPGGKTTKTGGEDAQAEPPDTKSEPDLVVDELPLETDASWVGALEKSQYGAGASLLVEGIATATASKPSEGAFADLYDLPELEGSAEEAALLADVAAARETGVLSLANVQEAWQEAVMAASYGDEQATRQALALVRQHVSAAKAAQAKLQQAAKKADALPAKPSPKERKADLRRQHQRMLAETLHVVAPQPQKQEWGFRLVDAQVPVSGSETPGEFGGSGTTGSYKTSWDNGGSTCSIGANWQMPETIIPGKPARISITGFATNGSTFSAHITMGNQYSVGTVLAGFRIHPTMPSNSSDGWDLVLPDFKKTLADRKNNTKPTLLIPLRDPERLDMIVVSHESGNNMTDTVGGLPTKTVDCFHNLDYSGDGATMTLAVRQYSGSLLGIYVYQWSPDCTADAATIESVRLPEEKEKAESIQFHRQNLQIIERSLSKDLAELGKESDPTRRASLEFRILQARSDIQAEKDLIASIQTGTIVHTRTPFDDYAHARFVQSIRENQVRMEDFQRAKASLPRLIALLPLDRQKAVKEFVDRQMTPEMLSKMDKESIRRIAEAVSNQVQGYWQGEAAKNEEKAAIADDYLTRAQRVKTIADVTVAVGSFGSASALYGAAAYAGTTGYVEGGPKEAVRQASLYLNAPLHAAMEAMKAYPKDGWTGAAKAGAIGFVMSKLTTMGTGGATAPGAKLTVKESMALAEFKQAQARGQALVQDFAKTKAELDAARKAGKPIQEVHALEAQLTEKAAIVHSDIHAKAFIKYKADAPLQSAFTRQIDGVHYQVEKRFHEIMAEAKWGPQELRPCRNSTSTGTANMDFDIMLVEKQGMSFTKEGSAKSMTEWHKEAQEAWAKAYKETTGRNAGHAMENLTTSGSAEAFKDLAWIGRDKSKVQSIWATQAGDVTRYKGAEILHDPKLGTVDPVTRLYEAARGAAKDIDTKLLDRLIKAPSASGVNPARRKELVEKWTEIRTTLKDIGEGRMDPIHGNRKIRALTGGYDIPNVIDHAGILMGEFTKRFGSVKPAVKAGAKGAPK